MVLPTSIETMLGRTLTFDERIILRDIPFENDVLERYSQTHLLLPGVHVTVREMQSHSRLSRFFARTFKNDNAKVFCGASFVRTENVPHTWFFLRDRPLDTRAHLPFDEQHGRLAHGPESLPTAAILLYARLLVWHAIRRTLFAELFAWTSESAGSSFRYALGSRTFTSGIELMQVRSRGGMPPSVIYSCVRS